MGWDISTRPGKPHGCYSGRESRIGMRREKDPASRRKGLIPHEELRIARSTTLYEPRPKRPQSSASRYTVSQRKRDVGEQQRELLFGRRERLFDLEL